MPGKKFERRPEIIKIFELFRSTKNDEKLFKIQQGDVDLEYTLALVGGSASIYYARTVLQ